MLNPKFISLCYLKYGLGKDINTWKQGKFHTSYVGWLEEESWIMDRHWWILGILISLSGMLYVYVHCYYYLF